MPPTPNQTPVLGVQLITVVLLALLASCQTPSTQHELEDLHLTFIPKDSQQTRAKKGNNGELSPYSCLISTLADEDADYNYWNRAFWLEFPQKAIKQAKGRVVLRAIALGSDHAGNKAGSWQGLDNVVRVAQCLIPDSPLAEELLETELRKFSKGTWMSNRKDKLANPSSSGWECGEYFITIACLVDPNTLRWVNCMITDVTCTSYVFIEEPIGGGGGSGFPGDDPGECDPTVYRECYGGPGPGGGQPPPEPPDPCSGSNPPAYCSTPCETGNPILDDRNVQLAMERLWNLSNYGSNNSPNPESQRKEQVGFIIPSPFGGYQLQILPSSLVVSGPCKATFKKPSNLPEGAILVHTHPYSNGEVQSQCRPGETRIYDSGPGIADNQTLRDLGLETGIILDADKIILFNQNETVVPSLKNRCGY